MSFSSEHLDIRINSEFGLNCLEFVFKGKFTEQASIKGTEAWVKIFDSNPYTKYTLLWNCEDMTGFEPGARKEWYRVMKIYKPRIKEVTVVSKHLIIRGAAKVMLEFFGIKSKVVRTIDELMVAT
ncbi:MAG: hypothetical protein JXR07_18535 [Reichenbachiella sp.]